MLNIIVFNWNYSRFLDNLFEKLSNIKDCHDVNIFICDDGSTDDSRTKIKKFVNKYDGVTFVNVSDDNYGRKYPFEGQLQGLKDVLNKTTEDNNYYWLLDADDYIELSDFSQVLKNLDSNKKLYITKLCNIDIFSGHKQYKKINRKIRDYKGISWPTTSPTSSLIVKRNFLINNQVAIFDFNYNEVWLDSRINMLADNLEQYEFEYIDSNVYRNIHDTNDSFKNNLKRNLIKQVQSYKFYIEYISNLRVVNFRNLILFISSKICRK